MGCIRPWISHAGQGNAGPIATAVAVVTTATLAALWAGSLPPSEAPATSSLGAQSAPTPGPSVRDQVRPRQEPPLAELRALYAAALTEDGQGFEAYLLNQDARAIDGTRYRALASLTDEWEDAPVLPEAYRTAFLRAFRSRLVRTSPTSTSVQKAMARNPDLERRALRLARAWSLHYALRSVPTTRLADAARQLKQTRVP